MRIRTGTAATTSRAASSRATPEEGSWLENETGTLLALLDEHRVVAVLGGRGAGKTALLSNVADRYGVDLWTGRAPEAVERGDLVVLDDASVLGARALSSLIKRIVRSHGRMVLSARTSKGVPASVTKYRVRELSQEEAVAFFEARCRSPAQGVRGLVGRLGGHPGLLTLAARIASSRRGRARSQAAVVEAMGVELRERLLDPHPRGVRSAAAKLSAAGGWLPLSLRDGGFSRSVETLVLEGLAEQVDDAVVASPLLLAALHERPGRRTLSSMLAAVRRYPGRGRMPLALLAEAHLLRGMGKRADAVLALRSAYRASRGTFQSEAYFRSLKILEHSEVPVLSDTARLASSVEGDKAWVEPLEDGNLELLLEEGSLEEEDAREARIAVARSLLGHARRECLLADLTRLAGEAEREGDHYGEAHALLWVAWLHYAGAEHDAARRLATGPLRLAKRIAAPALEERALVLLARCDVAEGDLERAGRRLTRALGLCRRAGLDDDRVAVLDALADVAGRVGRPSEAAAHLDEAQAIMGLNASARRIGELALTRAEVAMRRGHAGEASRILASRALDVMEDDFRRDLLSAEVALATGDLFAARTLLERLPQAVVLGSDTRRRRVGVVAGLLQEGLEPGVDLDECLEEPFAALSVERARADMEALSRRISKLRHETSREDPEGNTILLSESAWLSFSKGALDDGLERLRDLREHLVRFSPPTALMLLLEAVENLVEGDPYEAAVRSSFAHRTAAALGHRSLAAYATECLILAHLGMGRLRGLRRLLRRGMRHAHRFESPAREARISAYRAALAVRGGGSPSRADLARARSSSDPKVVALVDLVRAAAGGSRRSAESLQPLACWLKDLVLEGDVGKGASLKERAKVAVELFIDGDRREVTLPGGKKANFKRRRVLWRLLWMLVEAGGKPIEPEDLYRGAWELPFNQSRLNSLYVGMRRLRLLVEPDPASPRIILAGSRGGYSLDHRRIQVKGSSPFEEE